MTRPDPRGVRDACPDCGGELSGVEYAYGTPERYDGVSEWWCAGTWNSGGCGLRIGRWTGNRLAEGEREPRFGVDLASRA